MNYIRGMQGDDPKYLKTAATAKHFAVHSGPEKWREAFNAVVSARDLQMTYLPAFKACVTEGKVESVMGAYNALNGTACCANPWLLQKTLREDWGFDGYVVADCGAVGFLYYAHALVNTREEAAALAVTSGVDLECGCTYGLPCDFIYLNLAVLHNFVTEVDLRQAVTRLYTTRFRLGMFDPPEQVPYAQIPIEVVDSQPHREAALEAARQSLVLLKNENGILPLDKSGIRQIAVIGPNADDTLVQAGNYIGTPRDPVSVLAGIRAALPDAEVTFAAGCKITGGPEDGIAPAAELAGAAQAAVVVLGLSQQLEGEEDQTEGTRDGEPSSQGDRTTLDLPEVQEKLLKAVVATGTPVILVLINGSALSVNWADENVPAILEAWYPGQDGGTAVAEAIFGDTNPGGRLPVTVYRSVDDLPGIMNYSMENRTYRYLYGKAVVSLRIRVELHRVRLPEPPDRTGGDCSRRIRHRPGGCREHRRPRRRRSGATLPEGSRSLAARVVRPTGRLSAHSSGAGREADRGIHGGTGANVLRRRERQLDPLSPASSGCGSAAGNPAGRST